VWSCLLFSQRVEQGGSVAWTAVFAAWHFYELVVLGLTVRPARSIAARISR
jgi:hypothetical protein